MALPLATLPSLPRLPFLSENICGGGQDWRALDQRCLRGVAGRLARGRQALGPSCRRHHIDSPVQPTTPSILTTPVAHLVQRVMRVLHPQPHQQRRQVGLEAALSQGAGLGCRQGEAGRTGGTGLAQMVIKAYGAKGGSQGRAKADAG